MGFFFVFFFVLVGNHMHFDVPSECSQRKDALRGKRQTQSGDYSCQRGRGVRERERERQGQSRTTGTTNERIKKRKDTLERREKTGGGCCVAYDNLKLFDGINKKKKKNLMQESSLGPATDYSRRFACGSYYIIHSP